MATAINSEVVTTLRRRLVDKLCKDNFFLINVLGYAIRKDKINYIDLMTEEEVKLLTQSK